MYDVCVVGHITRDLIRQGKSEAERCGGVAYYAAMALKSLGANVALVTKYAERDVRLLAELVESKIPIFPSQSGETTFFENAYPEGTDKRAQNVRAIAEPFAEKDVPEIDARFFHIGPLTRQDIPVGLLAKLSRKAKISLDAQGFLRKVENGAVRLAPWAEMEEGLAHVHVLKADEEEARIMTGEGCTKKSAAALAGLGPEEVIITAGSRGSLIYAAGKPYKIPACAPRSIVDATGCGDTYIASYIYERLGGAGVGESGAFASAAAALKMERHGALCGDERDVRRFMATQAQIRQAGSIPIAPVP